MNEKELLDNKILCLKQLRLSKWQLIWNREFELGFDVEVEEDALKKLESQAMFNTNINPDAVKAKRQQLQLQMAAKEGEIVRAKKAIEKLDLIIKDLEETYEKTFNNNSGN